MFDWINGITADATTAFRAIVFLAAAVIFFVVAAKVRFAMATTIITGIACGLAMFLAAGGGEWVMGLIQTETVDAIGVTAYRLVAEGAKVADRDEEREVARFYTRSRRFPKFIGRLHDGTKIPGGPYTLTQGVVMAIVLVVALMTQSVWGTGSPIVDIPVAAFVSWGAAWGAGRIPATRRNLLSIITSGMSAMTRPAAGRYRGVTMRVRPPHFAGGGTTIAEPVSATRTRPDGENTAPAPEEPTVAQPVLQQVSTPLPAHAPAHAVSGVERLLQQARGGN